MKNLRYSHCLIGVGLAFAVLLALGASASTLGLVAVALACPLMMLVMMKTMMGDAQRSASPDKPVEQNQHH